MKNKEQERQGCQKCQCKKCRAISLFGGFNLVVVILRLIFGF